LKQITSDCVFDTATPTSNTSTISRRKVLGQCLCLRPLQPITVVKQHARPPVLGRERIFVDDDEAPSRAYTLEKVSYRIADCAATEQQRVRQ
jgi:hypothetical protein